MKEFFDCEKMRLFVVCISFCMLSVASGASVTGLQTDHLVEPAHIGPTPSFSWRMETSRKDARQIAYRIRVSRVPRCTSPKLVWDSGEVKGDLSTGIPYKGKPLASAQRYEWTVAVKDERGRWNDSAASYFSTGILSDKEWKGADWIAPETTGEYGLRTACFRRAVANGKEVVEAWCTVTSAGVFEMYSNGRAISSDFLKPGFTHPLKVRQACTYEITDMIDCRSGATNVFAAVVSASWSRDKVSCRSRPGRRSDPFLAPSLRAVIVLRHADGSERYIVTDREWQAEMERYRVRSAGIYEGETVDAREGTGWLSAYTVDWRFAKTGISDFTGVVRNFRGPPVCIRDDLGMNPLAAWVVDGVSGVANDRYGTARIVRQYGGVLPEKICLKPEETLVVDFGQNASAVPDIVLEAARTTRVEMRYAEMLNDGEGLKVRGNDGPGGTLYLSNLRTSFAGVNYICGGGKECYRPQFTFFGYRYAHIKADAPIVIHKLRSLPVTSVQEGKDTAHFECSNSRVNRLFENCRWGMYSNYLSVPTDCPQRDERVGWMADAQVFAPAGAYLADTYAFFSKWMADVRDSQRSDGCHSWVAPENNVHGYTIGWTDAGVIIPYVLWRRFGDDSIIRENWRSMERYMAYVDAKGSHDPQPFGDWLSYECGANADWLSPDRVKMALPGKRVLDFSYRIWTSRMMAEMAHAIGEYKAASRYLERERNNIDAFRSSCLARDGTLLPECFGQCSSLHALYLGLLPTKEAVQKTQRLLRDNFRKHGQRLQTGFLGTAILLDAVVEGLEDVELAYTLLLQDKNPSWLYSVDQGATTIWERWNSYTKESGFGPVAMNSFNHYAYGAVAGWMMATMAGIRNDPATPGFKHFVLAPIPDKRINFVRAAFRSPYGLISSEWKYDCGGDVWEWQFTVPANSSATVLVPGGGKHECSSGSYRCRIRSGVAAIENL